MQYLTVAEFKTRTTMPSEDVDYLEAHWPGYLDSRLQINSSKINARLDKRYTVPFSSPVPEIVLGWLAALVTPEAYRKRGWDPADPQSAQVEQDRKDALDEIKEAADSEKGLYDLPLLATNATSAVSAGGPLGYAEADPYTWTDIQVETVRGT